MLRPEVRQQCLSILRAGFQSPEFWPSMHAAEALTVAGYGDEVRAALEPKLASEQDGQRRCGLARELARAGDRQKVVLLLEALAAKDPYAHVHAAESLYKLGEIGDGKLLTSAAAQTANVKLQLMAAGALARKGDAAAMALVRAKANDDVADARYVADWILGRIGNASDIAVLRRASERQQDALPAAFAFHALACLEDTAGLERLGQNLAVEDAGIRALAAETVAQTRATRFAPRLIEMLSDPALDVRIRAAQSLIQLAQPAR